MGIGRPSTYAPTISTVQSRGYVERGDIEGTPKEIQRFYLEKGTVTATTETVQYGKDSGKLYPTETGKVVTDFLTKHFEEVMDYDFTKDVEEELDDIAEKKKDRVGVLKHFYGPFHKLVEASAGVSRAEVAQARMLGTDPKTKKPITARFGRYGPMLQRGDADDEDKPTFAPLPSGTNLSNVTLEQALEMFKLPRTVGTAANGEEMKANIGRFGPYIQVGKTFVSIKPLDPLTITEVEARELYDKKLEQIANRNIAEFPSGIKILNGPYGPYITDGKKNARIAKDADPKKITEADAKALLDAAPAKKSFRRRKKS
jgi:DNA topoisomerase-1